MIEDKQQQRIIESFGTTALVLAGPGCGKTHILARRVYHAASVHRVPFERMLCVTFTNRAAREMRARIEDYLGCSPDNLFIGNIHRFCLGFLITNNLVDENTSVLDEEDQLEFFADTLGLRYERDIRDFLKKKAYVFSMDHDFPPIVVRTPAGGLSDTDYSRIAEYRRYQEENHFVDFDDILLLAYHFLNTGDSRILQKSAYDWIQVDEVQDMTPLQLGIVELLAATGCTKLYFGDEQQAIFRFAGAGGPAMDWLKGKAGNNIYRLQRNYRSPSYLVDVCNEVALKWLNIPQEFLPKATDISDAAGRLTAYEGTENELQALAAYYALKWTREFPGENTAVLVRTNVEGNRLSHFFDSLGIRHFQISRDDLFHQVPFKTVWSHLAIVRNPLQTEAWARILYQTNAVRTLANARTVVSDLHRQAINPVELLNIDEPGVLLRLHEAFSAEDTDVIVFDTETTGTDIFTDDVVQIAAVRMYRGKIVPDSNFEVFIESDRELPKTLADGKPNPMADVYNKATKLPPEEAFGRFRAYIGDNAILAGHNIDFDKAIINNNISRRTNVRPDRIFHYSTPAIDTLELARLLLPRQNSYHLEDLLSIFNVEGVNSHLAGDDCLATARLLERLYIEGQPFMASCNYIRRSPGIQKIARKIRIAYSEFYNNWRQVYFSPGGSLTEAIKNAAEWFYTNGHCNTIERLDYVTALIEREVANSASGSGFRYQLDNHLYELLTYNESDLFANGIVREPVSIMTVHKAKGLEMPGVVIYDATSTCSTDGDSIRLLYVALSRAKKRLAIGMRSSPYGPLLSILPRFRTLGTLAKDRITSLAWISHANDN